MRQTYNFTPFADILDDFFGKSIGDILGGDISFNTPSANTYETDEAYHLEVAIPGISKQDIHLKLEQDVLVLSSDIVRSESAPAYKRKEFDYSKFTRRFTLKDDIQKDGITASYELGVLKVHLPKMAEEVYEAASTIQIK